MFIRFGSGTRKAASKCSVPIVMTGTLTACGRPTDEISAAPKRVQQTHTVKWVA